MIRFTCAQCGKTLKVLEGKVGAAARCPACGHKTRVPAESAAPARPAAPDDDETPNVELVDDVPAAVPGTPAKSSRPTRAAPAPLKRFGKLLFTLVAIGFVLLASVWGGMAFKAGGVQGAPKSWAEFKARLFQEAVPEKRPQTDKQQPEPRP
jgi:DNA-directed RNA polymerase subunit RPC12/RpoP